MIQRNIKSAVITGPTGTIGNALIELLLSKGIEVYAVIRPGSTRAAAFPIHEKLHIVACVAAEYNRLPDLIPADIDAFFHLAWAQTIGAGRNDMPSQINNIRYAIDAVNAAAKLDCRVFVGAGSQAECGRVEGFIRQDTPCFPENGYGMAKLCAGEMTRVECEKLGIDHIWMRVLSIYGPYDGEKTMIMSVIRSLLRGEKPALTAGEQQWDYLYCRDVAKGFYCAAESGVSGKIYPLGSGTARPLREYVEILRDQINPVLPLGFGEVVYAPKQVMHLQADISALQQDTGFQPAWSFENGIAETIEWVKKNG